MILLCRPFCSSCVLDHKDLPVCYVEQSYYLALNKIARKMCSCAPITYNNLFTVVKEKDSITWLLQT